MDIQLTTEEMLQALQQSKNEKCKEIADKILSGKTTVEEEKKYTGSFMTHVLEGDFANAWRWADLDNRIALMDFMSLQFQNGKLTK